MWGLMGILVPMTDHLIVNSEWTVLRLRCMLVLLYLHLV